MAGQEVVAVRQVLVQAAAVNTSACSRQGVRRGPNKTEAEFRRLHLADKGARFEVLCFRFANGHRYTPDWVYVDDGRLVCVEVKGFYRLGSHQRARLAFDQAVVEWPNVRWIWAERRKDGTWQVSEREADHGMSSL